MSQSFSNNAYHLPVYRKALEIFKISRAIASYFSGDKHVFEMNLSSNPQHRFAGILVSESLQLAPGIASVISTSNPEYRLQRIKKIHKVAKSLKSQCKKIELSGVKEIEFLNLLRKEIHIFDKMTSEWISQYKK